MVPFLGGGVQRRGGFVEQHRVRATRQCANDGNTLLFAAGETHGQHAVSESVSSPLCSSNTCGLFTYRVLLPAARFLMPRAQNKERFQSPRP